MDPKPLVTEEIDAGAELVREFDKFMPVKAAFWLYPSEKGRWLLYIASDEIEDRTIRDGYMELVRLTESMRNPYLDLFQVKLKSGGDPLVAAIMALHQRYPGKFPIRYGERRFGKLSVDAAYLYPLLAACP